MFVESFILDLPFGARGKWLLTGPAKWLAGGWQFNGIFTSQTGTPLTFGFSSTSLNAPFNGNRANVLRRPQI